MNELKASVTKCFEFEMAHVLEDSYYKDCQKVHGHSYKLEVTFTGPIQENGVVIDFKKVSEIVQPLVNEFDHSFQTPESFKKNPTAENMAMDMFNMIANEEPLITKVKLWETSSCFVEIKK